MTELREIKLSKLDPNPFRDGGGGQPAATWESVAEAYGYDEQKLAELQQSYEVNGVWAGVIVREHGDRYQLTFGHHRVEAARRLGLEKLPVIVEDLSDDQMLQRMAAENSEEYGHDFSLGVMNAVEAVVKAYGAGLIDIGATGKAAAKDVRQAPSFVKGEVPEHLPKPYTAVNVSIFLGWTAKRLDEVDASQKVKVALGALELIELGALKRQQLKGLGIKQSMELVTLTRRKMEQEKERVETQRAFLEKAKQKALREDDKRTVTNLTKKLGDLEADASKLIKQAGAAAAGTVTSFFKETKSMTAAAEKAAEALNIPKGRAVMKPKVGKKELASVDGLIDKVDYALRGDDPGWLRVLSIAEEQGDKKTFRLLDEALEKLTERVRERLKELRAAVKKGSKS